MRSRCSLNVSIMLLCLVATAAGQQAEENQRVPMGPGGKAVSGGSQPASIGIVLDTSVVRHK
jgi:hypothetical protein